MRARLSQVPLVRGGELDAHRHSAAAKSMASQRESLVSQDLDLLPTCSRLYPIIIYPGPRDFACWFGSLPLCGYYFQMSSLRLCTFDPAFFPPGMTLNSSPGLPLNLPKLSSVAPTPDDHRTGLHFLFTQRLTVSEEIWVQLTDVSFHQGA